MTTPARPIPVALIGYGYAGKTFHAPLVSATPGLRLACIASSQGQAVAADWPEARIEPDPLTAIHAPDIELVVIASPNDTHAPLSAAALAAGKHVVVDKPFTLELAEARALIRLAEQHGRLLSVFHNRRWDADFLALRALLADGRLGRLTQLESRFERFRPEVRARWREQAVAGGGVWYDLGPHLVDQALQLFGLPDSVAAHFAIQRDGAETDDWAQVDLDYGRLQVTLRASMLVAGGMPRFAAHGTAGSWVKYRLDSQEDQLKAGLRPGAPDWGLDPQAPTLYTADGTATAPALPRGDYPAYYAAIGAALRDDAPNPVPAHEALAAMAVIDAARRSARCGQRTCLDLTDQERRAWPRSAQRR